MPAGSFWRYVTPIDSGSDRQAWLSDPIYQTRLAEKGSNRHFMAPISHSYVQLQNQLLHCAQRKPQFQVSADFMTTSLIGTFNCQPQSMKQDFLKNPTLWDHSCLNTLKFENVLQIFILKLKPYWVLFVLFTKTLIID